MMLKGENSSAVVKRVKSKISEIQKMLPEGVVLQQVRLQKLDANSVQVLSGLTAGAVVAADATAYASDLSQQRRTAQE